MKTNFKVGDKVWDGYKFPNIEGVVKEINCDYNYPVAVYFDQVRALYTYDGRFVHDSPQTLSKVPYTFELPEQPVEFEKGDPVLVRDKDTSVWVAARFIEYANEGNCRCMVIVDAFTTAWKQCIPFDLEKMGRV